MSPLNLKVVVATVSLLGIVTFTIFMLWDLAVPSSSMMAIWKVLLPGFQGITWGSHILDLAVITPYAAYTALISGPSYNFFHRGWAKRRPWGSHWASILGRRV